MLHQIAVRCHTDFSLSVSLSYCEIGFLLLTFLHSTVALQLQRVANRVSEPLCLSFRSLPSTFRESKSFNLEPKPSIFVSRMCSVLFSHW